MPDYQITSASAVTSTTSTWTIWNGLYTANSTPITTTTATGTSATWVHWNHLYGTSSRIIQPVGQQFRPGRFEAAEGEKLRARERAKLLLQEALSPKQREQYAQDGFFDLESIRPDGERRIYRIRRGRSRNVQQVSAEGRVLKTLCAHPVDNVPDEDTMVAQKLWLETREDDFLRLANHS